MSALARFFSPLLTKPVGKVVIGPIAAGTGECGDEGLVAEESAMAIAPPGMRCAALVRLAAAGVEEVQVQERPAGAAALASMRQRGAWVAPSPALSRVVLAQSRWQRPRAAGTSRTVRLAGRQWTWPTVLDDETRHGDSAPSKSATRNPFVQVWSAR
jgi:hypothetical protein